MELQLVALHDGCELSPWGCSSRMWGRSSARLSARPAPPSLPWPLAPAGPGPTTRSCRGRGGAYSGKDISVHHTQVTHTGHTQVTQRGHTERLHIEITHRSHTQATHTGHTYRSHIEITHRSHILTYRSHIQVGKAYQCITHTAHTTHVHVVWIITPHTLVPHISTSHISTSHPRGPSTTPAMLTPNPPNPSWPC